MTPFKVPTTEGIERTTVEAFIKNGIKELKEKNLSQLSKDYYNTYVKNPQDTDVTSVFEMMTRIRGAKGVPGLGMIPEFREYADKMAAIKTIDYLMAFLKRMGHLAFLARRADQSDSNMDFYSPYHNEIGFLIGNTKLLFETKDRYRELGMNAMIDIMEAEYTEVPKVTADDKVTEEPDTMSLIDTYPDGHKESEAEIKASMWLCNRFEFMDS